LLPLTGPRVYSAIETSAFEDFQATGSDSALLLVMKILRDHHGAFTRAAEPFAAGGSAILSFRDEMLEELSAVQRECEAAARETAAAEERLRFETAIASTELAVAMGKKEAAAC